jgi:hypothetical protein
MLYDAERKAFHCHLCENPWKNIYTQVLVIEETDGWNIYCIDHCWNKIGTYDQVPEWRINGPTDSEDESLYDS